MKRDFHIIGAVMTGLTFGLRGLPTVLRLGWPAIALFGAALYLAGGPLALDIVQNGGTWQVRLDPGCLRRALQDLDVEILKSCLAEAPPLMATRKAAQVQALLLASFFASLPVYVALLREAAGRPSRPGILPLFGGQEFKVLLALIISGLILLVAIAIVAVPVMAFLNDPDPTLARQEWFMPATIAGSVIGTVFILWVWAKLLIFPAFVAVTGRLNPAAGFAVSGGRFIKLVLAIVLFVLTLGLIIIAAAFLVRQAEFMMGRTIWVFVGAYAVLDIYKRIAFAGFTGRVVGDLADTPSMPVRDEGRY